MHVASPSIAHVMNSEVLWLPVPYNIEINCSACTEDNL